MTAGKLDGVTIEDMEREIRRRKLDAEHHHTDDIGDALAELKTACQDAELMTRLNEMLVSNTFDQQHSEGTLTAWELFRIMALEFMPQLDSRLMILDQELKELEA